MTKEVRFKYQRRFYLATIIVSPTAVGNIVVGYTTGLVGILNLLAALFVTMLWYFWYWRDRDMWLVRK